MLIERDAFEKAIPSWESQAGDISQQKHPVLLLQYVNRARRACYELQRARSPAPFSTDARRGFRAWFRVAGRKKETGLGLAIVG